jgi:hypothetical protein
VGSFADENMIEDFTDTFLTPERTADRLTTFATAVASLCFLISGFALALEPASNETTSMNPHAGMMMAGSVMSMPGLYGPYVMTREASGTGWQPDSASMAGLHGTSGPWTTMLHGTLTGVYTHQGGPRGDSQTFNESMLMLMARYAVGDDAFSFRVMASLEPLMGPRGYPLLFQTGETANGRDPLIDRQHPHNLLGEVAGSYSKTLSPESSLFVYGGPIGEPALGPPAYMHRASSEDNPDAPLTHHWLDATHVSFGVVTAGVVWRTLKLEGSYFNGREPNEHRYSVQFRAFDSSSIRLSYNPTAHWSLQLSTARLASPEQLEPDTAVRRTTASAVYDRPFNGMHWQTTLAWGRDAPTGRHTTDGYLLDSAVRVGHQHTVFGRVEHVVKDELFTPGDPLFARAFAIRKASIGYVFDFAEIGHLQFGIGGLFSQHWTSTALAPAYGADPTGYSFFVRAKLMP